MALMVFTKSITLFMPARVETQFLQHFGCIPLFSLLTVYSISTAVIAIKKEQIKKHKLKMISLYASAITGGFAFAPRRFLHQFFFMN